MSVDIVMPRLSDSMEEGTVLTWMKAVGDEVALGEELVEIETDKANMVFESDAAGTLIEIVAGEGDTLPIGEVIARVGDPSEAPAGGDGGEDGKAPAAEAASPAPQAPSPTQQETPSPATAGRDGGGGRVKASPLARRIAGEKGIDLHSVQGSGPGGRIIKADVENAPQAGGRLRPPQRWRAAAPRHHPRPPRVRSRRSSSPSCSRPSAAGWPSRRRPPRTSTCRRRST